MDVILAFAITLLAAVLLSCLAERSVISTAVIFLIAGVFGGASGLVTLSYGGYGVAKFAEIALFSVLFTDGMRTKASDIIPTGNLAGRAIFLGIPLTLVGIAVLARFVIGISWLESFLIGAVLSPTDPVFAAAIVGRKEIPIKVRQLLNIESGLNDGLVLPIIIFLLALMGEAQADFFNLIKEVFLGIVVGVVVPWLAIYLSRNRYLSVAGVYQSLYAFAIGLLVYAISSFEHANLFLAAFSAGITVSTVSDEVTKGFERFGEPLTELLKLSAILVFGVLISLNFLNQVSWQAYVFALLILILVRPAALGISLYGNDFSWREWITTVWFGPKGFASVVYGLLIVKAGVPHGEEVFYIIALVVVMSIIAHSSTDVLVAHWFEDSNEDSMKTV